MAQDFAAEGEVVQVRVCNASITGDLTQAGGGFDDADLPDDFFWREQRGVCGYRGHWSTALFAAARREALSIGGVNPLRLMRYSLALRRTTLELKRKDFHDLPDVEKVEPEPRSLFMWKQGRKVVFWDKGKSASRDARFLIISQLGGFFPRISQIFICICIGTVREG